MSLGTVSRPARIRPDVRSLVAAALAGWLALVVVLGAQGWFVAPPQTPPLPIAVGFLAPLAAFFAALAASRAFRRFVLALDARVLLAIQAWRLGGFTFLALYVHGILPGVFAWPAGLGDIAIGLSAPLVLRALLRRPGFAASRAFLAWNAFGILDLLTAVGVGAVNTWLAGGVGAAGSTSAMAELPLVLIPAYLVPLFVMLHVAAFAQARELARA